ncbi:Os02g0567450, partial [Oryza sativa Japonica Group]
KLFNRSHLLPANSIVVLYQNSEKVHIIEEEVPPNTMASGAKSSALVGDWVCCKVSSFLINLTINDYSLDPLAAN